MSFLASLDVWKSLGLRRWAPIHRRLFRSPLHIQQPIFYVPLLQHSSLYLKSSYLCPLVRILQGQVRLVHKNALVPCGRPPTAHCRHLCLASPSFWPLSCWLGYTFVQSLDIRGWPVLGTVTSTHGEVECEIEIPFLPGSVDSEDHPS